MLFEEGIGDNQIEITEKSKRNFTTIILNFGHYPREKASFSDCERIRTPVKGLDLIRADEADRLTDLASIDLCVTVAF